MAESAFVFSVSANEFQEKVLAKSHEVPIVVDFWAPWCGPCRSLAPVLEKLVNQRNGDVLLAKVNTDDEQELAASFRVEGIPLVVAIKEGKAVDEFVGMIPEPQIAEFLDRLKPSETDKRLKEAVEFEKSDPAQAERIYREVLTTAKHHEGASLGLARVLIEKNQLDEANALLENFIGGQSATEIEKLKSIIAIRVLAAELGSESDLQVKANADPKNAQVLFDLGTVLAAQGKYPEALDLLLRAGEFDKKLAQSKVRETMVRIFHVVGVRSDLADVYRDKLSSILY